MINLPYVTLVSGAILLQLATFASAAENSHPGEGVATQIWVQQQLQNAKKSPKSAPEAIVNAQGKFRVKGFVRKKTAGLDSCSCSVSFSHYTSQGRSYSQYGQATVAGNLCEFNVPFHFDKGDSGRPVSISLSASCSGSGFYRSTSQSLGEIPLPSGNSKIIAFDVDM